MSSEKLPEIHRSGYLVLSDFYFRQHNKVLQFFLDIKVPFIVVFHATPRLDGRPFRVYVPPVYHKALRAIGPSLLG